MLPNISLFGLTFPVPGLIFLVGLWLGINLAERYSHIYHIAADDLYNVVALVLIGGLLGARLTYVASYPIIFAADPISLISPNIGLLDPWGAIIGSILSGLFYAQYRRNISLFPLLDAMTPIFAVLTVSNGLVNLASGSGFGAESNLPWAIWLFGAHRHPTQIYEALAATAILAFLWRTWIKIPSPKSGVLFFTYIALTAGMRLFLEYFRADSIILTGGFRQAQLFAWLILASSLYALGRLRAPIK